MALAPVCVLAGGLGTRLGGIVADTPKPILQVAGKPFLEHQLDALERAGATRVVLCVGYLGEQIEQTFGPRFRGIELRYSYDPPQLAGTAGAVRAARPLLDARFLVLYGDTYLRIDYAEVDRAHQRSGLLGLLTVLRNRGQWDVSNSRYERGRVVRYDKQTPTADMEWIDYGLSALRSEALDLTDSDDLADLYTALADAGQLAGFVAEERFYEIGTPDALSEADRFLRAVHGPPEPHS